MWDNLIFFQWYLISLRAPFYGLAFSKGSYDVLNNKTDIWWVFIACANGKTIELTLDVSGCSIFLNVVCCLFV